jgi:hypothetical protein
MAIPVCGAFAQAGTAAADRSDVRIVSSFVAAGEPVPPSCREQAHLFAASLVRLPRPLSWHWVLVCDESGWRRFLRVSGRGENEPIYASTDLEDRTTYLRGDKLVGRGDFGAEMDRVVAHELAHIRLNGGDEAEAECLAQDWLRSARLLPRAKSAPENGGD